MKACGSASLIMSVGAGAVRVFQQSWLGASALLHVLLLIQGAVLVPNETVTKLC